MSTDALARPKWVVVTETVEPQGLNIYYFVLLRIRVWTPVSLLSIYTPPGQSFTLCPLYWKSQRSVRNNSAPPKSTNNMWAYGLPSPQRGKLQPLCPCFPPSLLLISGILLSHIFYSFFPRLHLFPGKELICYQLLEKQDLYQEWRKSGTLFNSSPIQTLSKSLLVEHLYQWVWTD